MGTPNGISTRRLGAGALSPCDSLLSSGPSACVCARHGHYYHEYYMYKVTVGVVYFDGWGRQVHTTAHRYAVREDEFCNPLLADAVSTAARFTRGDSVDCWPSPDEPQLVALSSAVPTESKCDTKRMLLSAFYPALGLPFLIWGTIYSIWSLCDENLAGSLL